MTNSCKKIVQRMLAFLIWWTSLWAAQCMAVPSVQDYDAVPPLLASSAKPMIMLALSKDHQLFYKAFTDYDDLDKDGFVDTTYKNSLEYAGYFDSYKCYTYDNTNKMYVPASINTDKYCNGSSLASDNIQWSGNFLNWATMTRIDEVRQVLYGGYRSTDTSSATVLERTYLPNDAHSFAKYYDGSDLDRLTPFTQTADTCGTEPTDTASAAFTTYNTCKQARGITLCNTTRYAGTLMSQGVSAATNPPLARAVRGNYSLWAANERMQCLFSGEASAGGGNGNDARATHIFASANNPATSAQAAESGGTTIGDYAVRVKVCVSAGLVGQEDCRSYPSGNLKPIGILQEFGDDDSAYFGLTSGSYKKNKSGGVLRKNIGTMTNEINVTTDGTFKAAPATGGIINTVNQFRMVNYNFNSGSEGTYNSSDNCSWGASSFSDGSCTNWGNPFSELMLECYRYFAGKQPDFAFDGDDSTYFSGLTRQASWANPQTNDTACANLNLIAFNSSTVSYDADRLGFVTDLNTASSAQQLTKIVGDGEGITGKYYFVGQNGAWGSADNNQLCTSKLISDLGLVFGTCPDAPRLEGSFRVAGMAYQAHTADLRTDITDNQTITTYGVTLSPALPKVTVSNPSNGKTISLLPACRNSSVGGNCAIVDFKIISQTVTATEARGSFFVVWEDSEQGGDYDQDMAGILSYTLTATGLTVTSDVFAQSTGYTMGFGFVVSGTVNDGFHVLSGINSYTGNDCTNCNSGDAVKSATYALGATSVSGSTVGLLEQPLYYAAKWGGFRDSNANSTPDLTDEWDRKNNTTGLTGADGIPDTYFAAINPKELKNQLTAILVNILARTAAGTSAALVSNTGAGEGAIFQALYNPRVTDPSGVTSVSWVGSLNAMFIDRYGNIREDNAEPYGKLTSADNILTIYYDSYDKRTYAQRYAITSTGTKGSAVGTPIDVLNIRPIWSARDSLAAVSDRATQRSSYGNLASSGRYMLTGIDKDADGQIAFGSAQTEVVPFTPASFPASGSDNTFRLLGLDTATKSKAADIVNYVRGVEGIAGYRNRTLDVDGDGVSTPWLLGDIVHSSPVSVGRPSASYDVTFGDDTYRDYRQAYEKRRQVVYVGSNDGMLHAFNSGFFNAATLAYDLTGSSGETQHPLGSELWAYVPYNLLPHLQWLTRPDYPHVYYVDASVKTFDVNIFTPDSTHPGGWGTIIVVGMRLGGGDYTLDPNSNDDSNPTDDITLRSAYVIMDVTDPEQPPVLIGEITNADLGYTTVESAVLKLRASNATDGSYNTPDINRWFLAVASGPRGTNASTRADALNSAVSSASPHVYFYDLASKTLHTDLATGESSSFVGGIGVADWNNDYMDDNFYYGTVGGTPTSPSGKLKRGTMTLSGSSISFATTTLLDVTNQPFSAPPITVRDLNNNDWIYAGTGRFLVVDDNNSTATQSYYAVKEPKSGEVLSNAIVAKTALINTTDIQVFIDGKLRSASTGSSPVTLNNGASATTFYDVVDEVSKTKGWYFNFSRTRSRNTTAAVVSDQALIFSEYQPSSLKCQPEGQGYLNAPHLLAGIPGAYAPIGSDSSVTLNGKSLSKLSTSLGQGSPSTPQIYQNSQGVRSAIVQTSTGQINWQTVLNGTSAGQRQSWQEIPITW